MKCNGHLTFQWVIDGQGTHSDANTILSCNVVVTHGFSSHNCVTKKVNKQVKGKTRNFKLNCRDQRNGNKGTTKSCRLP